MCPCFIEDTLAEYFVLGRNKTALSLYKPRSEKCKNRRKIWKAIKETHKGEEPVCECGRIISEVWYLSVVDIVHGHTTIDWYNYKLKNINVALPVRLIT